MIQCIGTTLTMCIMIQCIGTTLHYVWYDSVYRYYFTCVMIQCIGTTLTMCV